MAGLGIDFGTSGARAVVLSSEGRVLASVRHRFSQAEVAIPSCWAEALWELLGAIAPDIRAQLDRIAVNGTSATVMLCSGEGNPITPVLLYNDDSARSALALARSIAPSQTFSQSPALSATASLIKALFWSQTLAGASLNAAHVAHQADWIAALLHGQRAVSDYHNALKLGYDARTKAYPHWLKASPVGRWLPVVMEPGVPVAPILPAIADRFQLPRHCQICAGTTDSIAAFVASGAKRPGEAVTSLGSTLVLKLLSERPINETASGLYSHRLGDLWLVGGASNTGGAVLSEFFSPEQLAALSETIATQLDLTQPSGLDYYPLRSPGERFPINDPDYPPRLTPRPPCDRDFLYGLLEGIARIEAQGYQAIEKLGGPALVRVYSAGGGAKNTVWQSIRERYLQVKVTAAAQTEAAHGTARLALQGLAPYAGLAAKLAAPTILHVGSDE